MFRELTRFRSLKRARPWVLLLVTLLVTGVAAWAPAAAAPGVNCETHQWQVDGYEYKKDGSRIQYGLHGMRGDVTVYVYFYCNYVNSITIISSQDTTSDRVFAEFGWVNGYSNCDGQYYTHPELFVWWSDIGDGNAKKCYTLGSAPGPGYAHKMRLSDTDLGLDWWPFYDGVKQLNGRINTNFTGGAAVVNSERSNSSDVSDANFNNLDEYISQWSSFDNVGVSGANNDPDYVFQRVAADHSKVVHN